MSISRIPSGPQTSSVLLTISGLIGLLLNVLYLIQSLQFSTHCLIFLLSLGSNTLICNLE